MLPGVSVRALIVIFTIKIIAIKIRDMKGKWCMAIDGAEGGSKQLRNEVWYTKMYAA